MTSHRQEGLKGLWTGVAQTWDAMLSSMLQSWPAMTRCGENEARTVCYPGRLHHGRCSIVMLYSQRPPPLKGLLCGCEQIKQSLIKTGYFADTTPCHLVSGLGAGFFAVCVGSPVDVVKSRMMGTCQPGYLI